MILLFAAACASLPNDPPKLLSFNGVSAADLRRGYYDETAFTYVPGQDFPLVIEARDPQGQDIRLWWPRQPPGWEFDPDATSGVWHVPADQGSWQDVTLILEDTHPTDPRRAEWWFSLWDANATTDW